MCPFTSTDLMRAVRPCVCRSLLERNPAATRPPPSPFHVENEVHLQPHEMLRCGIRNGDRVRTQRGEKDGLDG